jgi:putative sterol carrier protein
MSDEWTIEDVMSRMPGAFQSEKAAGIKAAIQYHLTGAEAGDWVIRLGDGLCQVEKGVVEAPNLTLTADSADYLAIITGKLNAMSAFAEARLKLKGDLGLAMKLITLFKLPA